MTRAVCPLHATALRYPEAPAVIGPSDEVLTYRECDRKAQVVASAFGARGIEAGKRLAFVDPAGIKSLPVLFGAFRAGLAVYIPNKHLPQAGLQENIGRIGCSHIVGRRPMGGSLPPLDPEELIGPSPIEGLLDVDPYAPATILATSGTTAEPKMAVHSLDNHVANAEASNKNISLRPGDRWLLSLPLYHVSGLGIIFRCVLGGGAIALAERGEALQESIARLNVTHVSLVATQLQRLLETPDGRETLSRLKAALLGGSAIPQNLIEGAVGLGVPLHTTYGLTETASQVTTTPPEAAINTLKTSGNPLNPGTIRLAKYGEIEVSGRTLFLGYLAEDGSIRRPVTSDGWFPTGDLGHFDAGQNLVVTGRKDNMFISGGENIQPEEIEAALCALDEVSRAVVVPVPDTDLGHRPLAIIEPAPGFNLKPERLGAHLQNQLPPYKLPVAYLPWPADAPETGIKANRRFFQQHAAKKRP